MNSRSAILIRSVGVGAFTKVVGSLTVFVGLPIIAHTLSAQDYATFLSSMSAASFTTLWLGATVVVSVRMLSTALSTGSSVAIKEAECDTAGLFVLSMLAATLGSLALVLVAQPSRPEFVLLAVLLSALTGVFLWGDSYRVALRTDHISSLWQLLFTSIMLVLLAGFSRLGLGTVTLIYFGIPLIAQVTILIHLHRERRISVSPRISRAALRGHMREVSPILVNSIADYVKIFGSGLALLYLYGAVEYARYATIVLLIARLANPLSLITRPLMPAYIDALVHRDRSWLRAAKQWLLVATFSGALLTVVGASLMRSTWFEWLLPSNFERLSRLEIVMAGVFLLGISLSAIMNPVYIARHKSMMFSAINAIFVTAGVGIGCLLTAGGIHNAMLFCMASASAASGAVLTTYAVRSLLDVPDDGYPSPSLAGATEGAN